VRAFYRVSEPASVSLHHGDDNPVRSPPRTAGKLEWYARGLLPGLYTVGLEATDIAGNSTDALVGVTTVRLRYVRLSPPRIIVPTGVRFGVRVSTDVPTYRWRLGARTGTAEAELLTLRAPTQAGRYTLAVSAGRHRAAIPVFVRARP
jgi:hypothetical protein